MSKVKDGAQEIAQQILFRTKQMFEQHKTKIQNQNLERNYGGLSKKNDKLDAFYTSLGTTAEKVDALAKKVRNADKLRSERKEYYLVKLADLSLSFRVLTKEKNVKIKINSHVLELLKTCMELIDECSRNIDLFQTESSQLCGGKAYNVKMFVQRSFCELTENCCLWSNLSRFESITNDSVKEIFLPVAYDETVFKDIESDIERIWSSHLNLISEKEPPTKFKPVEPVIEAPKQAPKFIKSALQEAHQLFFGFTRPQQIPKAIELYRAEAEKQNSDPSALNALGMLYEEGNHIHKNITKAMGYYIRSARLNDPEGLYRIGKLLEKGGVNYHQHFKGLFGDREAELRGSIDYYERAAKYGHLDAMTDLGYIYEKGISAEDGTIYIGQYPQVAFKYYSKAKKEQFPRAINNLGNLCLSQPILIEEGEKVSRQKGIAYLETATQMKYPKSFINLARCYLNGVGVAPNLSKARALLLKGAQLGDIHCHLDYVRTFVGQNLEDPQMMMELIQLTRQVLLVDKSNAEALYFMGLFEEKGIGTTPNKQSSFYYISEAAKLNFSPALTKLGDYYYSGHHVDRDCIFAQRLYEKAAEKKDSQAMVNLGLMFEKGVLEHNSFQKQENKKKAEGFYREAAKLGNTNAVFLLGLNQKGNNVSTAVQKAADMGNPGALHILNSTAMRPNRGINKSEDGKQALQKLSTHYMKSGSTRGFAG